MLTTSLADTRKGDIPDIIVDGLHHAVLGLADGLLQTLGLALTGVRGRGMADGAVWIHPDDAFPRLGGIVFSGSLHRFSIRARNVQVSSHVEKHKKALRLNLVIQKRLTWVVVGWS
jgi:hypothetical protein